ncbi:MAG: ribosome small subunit-dependent GTPase A [Fibrobacter sp.]|jgi:ribosome biogenesis GTPase|nr:ribosome small subunit-dependent GTPase A [Fibrobacter sp.]
MSSRNENEKGTHVSRRENRAKRVNAMEMWEKGVLDERPVKERWSREFKNPRLKRLKNPVNDFSEECTVEGLVQEVHRRTFEVRLSTGETVSAIYRATVVDELGEFPAVGDSVVLGVTLAGEYSLVKVKPRRSELKRPGPRDRIREELTLAANIDQVILVASVEQPSFSYGFADRFLLAANWNHLPLVMVLNKIDLVAEIPNEILDFVKLVDGFIPFSCKTGEGLDALKRITAGKVSVFSGKSGVGKSSLINLLVPSAELRTGYVRDKDGKGRHTTTSSSLLDLPGGGMVIDTPGIRALGILDLDRHELARSFPGFFEDDLFTCKYGDCLHISEPGCAVLRAVENGKISRPRYESYLRILNAKD